MTRLPTCLATLSLLASLVLSGCSGKGGGDADTDALAQEFEEYEATSETGVVRGVVIDDAIRPIAGAEVRITLKGGDKNATTSENGAFGFEGLEPGTYFLAVSKVGYNAVQASVDVAAGVADPAITKIMLMADPELRPFFEVLTFEGYLQCSVRFVVNALAACSVLPNSADKPFSRMHPAVVPTFAQSEMVWDSTQALGDGLKMQYTDDSDGLDNYVIAIGGSPLVISANQTLMEEKNVGDEDVGLYVRVFSGSVDGTTPPSCPWGNLALCEGVSVVVNQSFKIYTVLFYNMLPPEGWTFGADGEPPQP